MEKLNGAILTGQARQCLEGKDSRKLAAFHAGITAGVALVITLLQYGISLGIGNASGLAGLGTRSILQTVQTVLQWGNIVLMPFWMLGFTYAAMQWARGNTPIRQDLLTGFRRFGPYLRLMLIRVLLMFLILTFCANISSIFYMLTPASTQLMAMVADMDMDQMYEYLYAMDTAKQMQLLKSMTPMFIIWGILSCIILVPMFYRFRMAEYAILNRSGTGAMAAMLISNALTRRRKMQIFKLDLRFWWYYALELLCSLLCYGDILLTLAGVTLPVDGHVLYMGCYVLYLAALVCVRTAFFPKVQTTYALAYETLVEMAPVQERPAQKPADTDPGKLPWDET